MGRENMLQFYRVDYNTYHVKNLDSREEQGERKMHKVTRIPLFCHGNACGKIGPNKNLGAVSIY